MYRTTSASFVYPHIDIPFTSFYNYSICVNKEKNKHAANRIG